MNDQMNRSPPHYAAAGGDDVAVARLVDGGADVNDEDVSGYTPFHFASQNNHAKTVELLLRLGANVESVDSWGNTPLFRAVFNYQVSGDTILALRAAGANPTHANKFGQTPLQLARTIANYDTAQYFNDLPPDDSPSERDSPGLSSFLSPRSRAVVRRPCPR